jgi:PD-(D/E)XK nuclease superfamily
MNIIDFVKNLRGKIHKKDILFLLPVKDKVPQLKVAFMKDQLSFLMMDFVFEEVDKDLWMDIEPFTGLKGLFSLWVSSRKRESVRSILKAAFWTSPSGENIAEYSEIIKGEKPFSPEDFNLKQHGWFCLPTKSKVKPLVCRSFEHEQIYRFRYDTAKLSGLNPKLSLYLMELYDNCPNHLFYAHGIRCSNFSGRVATVLNHESNHEVCKYAGKSHHNERFKSRHENCQYHFLINDPFTAGVEIPVWLEAGELVGFRNLFGGNGPLTGHIDLVREKGGYIEVWDYKPRAKQERNAATQVFLYTLMLSMRTGIPLKFFICGYFDEYDSYTFSPLNRQIIVNQ